MMTLLGRQQPVFLCLALFAFGRFHLQKRLPRVRIDRSTIERAASAGSGDRLGGR